ncbi:MAG: hypothetical protein PHU86_04115, partial [Patescibacteria group bacterium]|nr:hypothetical protein [Patescibacteria group bacterium]
MEADIKTQLIAITKEMSRLINKIFYLSKLTINLFGFLASKVKNLDPSLFTHQAKGQVVKAKHKTINFYKRPISDISHLSIMIVIVL